MKKITLTFLVSDDVATEVSNELMWGNYGNAAQYMYENGEESHYDFQKI